MKSYNPFFIGLLLFLFSCNSNKENNNSISFAPKVVEAHGYVVPKDSMAEPRITMVDEKKLKKIRAGIPKKVLAYSNVHPAGIPTVVKAGIPRICIPGQGNYTLPKIVPAIDSPFLAGIPEVEIAKEAYAKEQNPQNFSVFGKLQGLNHGFILCLLLDTRGNLWFGTLGGGVSKYDGKSFTHFTEKEGLSNNVVRCILEDKSGNLWFGTGTGGVNKYDGKYFTHFTEKEGLSNNAVSDMVEDRNGHIWIATFGGGVNKYDASGATASGEAGKSFTHFTEKVGLSLNIINCILEDKHGNLWFGTNGEGISKYDGKAFTHYTGKEGLSDNVIFDMLEDKNGSIWFGTNGGGVYKFDTSGDAASGEAGKSLSDGKAGFTHFTEKEGLSNNNVWQILEDKYGNLWFGTFGGGVTKYHPHVSGKTGATFTHYTEKEGLSNNVVRSMLEDNYGNLWIGTNGGGINKYDLSGDQKGVKTFTHYTEKEGLSNKIVRSILEDKKGNLWFGTLGGGVNKYAASRDAGKSLPDGKAGFTQYTVKEGLSSNTVWCMVEDKSGNLWFGTGEGGVNKFDGKDITYFTDKDGLGSNDIRCMLEDRSGNLWFGTGGGVSKYDASGAAASGEAGASFTLYTEKEGLSDNLVRSILEDKSGNLWFGTAGGGVSKYDPSAASAGEPYFTHFTEKEGLNQNEISTILEDKRGNLWFGTTGGGISKYAASEAAGASFTHFTEKEGLSNDIITDIMEDKRGNLWIGTLFGLNKLEENKLSAHTSLTGYTADKSFYTKQRAIGTADQTALSPMGSNALFKTYTYDDGFSGMGVNPGKTIFEARDGTIWIGADDRLTAMHPGADTPDTVAPNIQLTGISMFNENIAWQNLVAPSGKDDLSYLKGIKDTSLVLSNGVRVHDIQFEDVSRWYGIPEQLSLAHDNNYLTFHFVGITIQSPKRVKYQYKLEGVDQKWSALTSRSEATYGNLPYGKYNFKVKAMNGGGYWSDELGYSFKIRPPWWFTWWAYSLYGLLTGFAVWSIYRYQKRRIIRNERAKSQERELVQAKEIEKAYTELKATQAQLIQSEKMASLGELTAGIAHEIQNPLNFVNNFSEVNTELIDEMKNELHSDNKQEAITIADEIKQNEQKINLHGKRADAIVKSMLQHSQIKSGHKEMTDVNALADEYLRLAYHAYQAGLRAKDKIFEVVLITDFDSTLNKINIIPQEIGRVLLNLFNNAFWAVGEKVKSQRMISKSSHDFPTYSPTVTLTTKNLGNSIEISIRDNGPGIPKNIIDKIFQPFFTTKPTGQGTGLGLSLAYDIITKGHSGSLELKSPVDQEGAEFIISLPVN